MTRDRIPTTSTLPTLVVRRVAPAVAALLMPVSAAFAHSGHGLAGQVHWHATDVLPWLGLVAVGALVYLARRK